MKKKGFIFPIGLILLTLVILAGGGIVLFHFFTTPREEGIAALKIENIEPFGHFSEFIGGWTSYIKEGRPAEVIDLPTGAAEPEKLRYFSIAIGKKQVFAAVHVMTMVDAIAWIDTDMDLRFSDEEKLTGRLSRYTEQKNVFVFGPAKIHNDEYEPAPFFLTCYANSWMRFYPATYNTGKIKLEGQVYKIITIDGDYDGRLETLFSPTDENTSTFIKGDAIYMEPKRLSLFKRKYIEIARLHPLGRYYKTPQQYYSIEITNQGRTVHMEHAEPVLGTLKFGTGKQLRVQVFSDTATQTISIKDEIMLPVGLYQMQYGRLTLKDKQEMEWQLMPVFANSDKKGKFEITEGKTTEINPGPPFTIRTDARRAGDKLAMDVMLAGNEGETYGFRFSRQMAEPTVKIFAENGNEVHSGTLEYG